MPKTRAKPVNCNIHNENGEDFLIYDWILIKVEENFSAQTCDHLKDEVYRLLNFFENSITDTLQIHESEYSIKISLFSIFFI